MHKRGEILVVLALFAALVVPVARADEPQKLSPSEVQAIDSRDSEALDGFRAVYKSSEAVSRGCPVLKAHPQAKAAWFHVVGGYLELAEAHSERFTELADDVDAFLKRDDAYPDPADQKQLSSGVADMALGLRMRAGAVNKYISALKKAEAFDCAGFATDAGEVLTLLKKSHARYVPGFDALIHLALEH
jgi:hypothetical protein